MRRFVVLLLVAIALGAASGIIAYRYLASKPHPAHSNDSSEDDFDPGF